MMTVVTKNKTVKNANITATMINGVASGFYAPPDVGYFVNYYCSVGLLFVSSFESFFIFF